MKILFKTKALFALLVVLLVLNILDSKDKSIASTLPMIVELPKDDISRLEISDASQKIILSKKNGEWVMESPEKGKADYSRIRALLLNFRKSIPMDALIDTDNEQDYGLDAGNALIVEIWTNSVVPEVSFLLGADTAQGSSFVRLSGSDSIYRARVGGRRRYAYSATDWLSQQVIPLELNDVVSLHVQGTERLDYRIVKGEQNWRIQDLAPDVLDQERIGQTIISLMRLRIGERVEGANFTSQFSIVLGTTSQEEVELEVGEFVAGGAIVHIGERYYRVASPALERFTQGADYFLDRKLLRMQDRQALDLLQFSSLTQQIIIQQDLSNNFWNVLEPANLDLDLRNIFFMVNSLLSIEYVRSLPDAMTLPDPLFSIVLRSLSGESEQLSIYRLDGEQFVARSSFKEGVFGVSTKDIEAILNGFGQSNTIK